MWFAFAIVLLTSGQVSGGISPVPFATEKECIAKNVEVEQKLFRSDAKDNGVLAYHFDCKKLEVEDFKKPGLDS